MGNKRLVLTPAEACEAICKLCTSEYKKGKRKVNINKVWDLAYAGLPENGPVDTHTIPVMFGNHTGTDTTVNTDNRPLSGIIG